ncbi:MAG: hypothetical protein HKN04_13220 [Rhodothermaceae bacterium]|nr:hypothetical protein [Rhodothermaceae bacterium]
MHRQQVLVLSLLMLTAMCAASAHGQPSSVSASPASLSLTLLPSVDDSLRAVASGALSWRSRRFDFRRDKITVSTFAPGQRYALRVTPTNVRGTARPAGTVELVDGRFAQDLIYNIWAPWRGSADLTFEAAASPDDGAGTDVHVVTYTLTYQ